MGRGVSGVFRPLPVSSQGLGLPSLALGALLLFDPRFYPRYLCHYFALASLPPVSRLPALVRVPPWVAGPGPTLLPQSTSDAMGSLQTCAYISHWPNLLFFPVPRGAVCERAWLLG